MYISNQNFQENIGTAGEKLIAEFFDSKFSRFYSFPNPKTKANQEVADVLVWLNRIVFLIEVKTRSNGSSSIESWIKGKIKEAVEQLCTNHQRIKNNEVINLHNEFYQAQLDCQGTYSVVGIIVLVYDEVCNIHPSTLVRDIYEKDFPIHVFSWNDLQRMVSEIDTVPDFKYYLNDRINYVKNFSDISLDNELNALGYYKSKSNNFPKVPVDFSKENFWEDYYATMLKHINKRNEHNKQSWLLDKIENIFTDARKLFNEIPLGLYFVWEIGSLSRRERAYYSEKLHSVREWFENGNTQRYFAMKNMSTENWLVFYFSKSAKQEFELERLVELKMVKEIMENEFNQGVYGFGFQVSTTFPPRLLNLANAIVISAEVVKDKCNQLNLEEAKKYFGGKESYTTMEIKEFPEDYLLH
jgi:Holliday junction resolvase